MDKKHIDKIYYNIICRLGPRFANFYVSAALKKYDKKTIIYDNKIIYNNNRN